MSENDFWNSSPSKIFELADVHVKVNKPKEKSKSSNRIYTNNSNNYKEYKVENNLPYIDD